MELSEFLAQTQNEVRQEIQERIAAASGGLGSSGNSSASYPYPELVFAELVMDHMAEVGMTFEPVVCHYTSKLGNATLRLSGYSVSEDSDQLDLFVSLYSGAETVTAISDTETKQAADQCLRFLAACADGRLARTMDQSNEAFSLVTTIQGCYATLDQVRIYVLTDRQAKAKQFKAREVGGRTIKLEVMDIERLHRHWSEGKPRDELVVNFEQVCGTPLPCVYVPGEGIDYDYALTAIPGEALRFLYEKFGARMLEANVRSFLSATGKINKGIRDTLVNAPERFMAYNNGIVLVADEAVHGRTADGSPAILHLTGMQIVNGGQTTASIYFTKKKNPGTDLSRVRVPAKIIVLRSKNAADEEDLIATISKCANSQNAVRQSDLSANKPFHVDLEKLSNTTYCPDGVGRWFYERAAGSYNTMLAREGTTPARLKHLKQVVVPPSRRITKTDLAKYLNSWDQRPDVVSTGAQKNFEKFMDNVTMREEEGAATALGVAAYKVMVAKAILFRKVQTMVRPMFPAFQGNVAVYLVAILANRLGDRFQFDRIWSRQDISPALKEQLQIWAHEVNEQLHKAANGRMISEAAKKPECWEKVRAASLSTPRSDIPELQ